MANHGGKGWYAFLFIFLFTGGSATAQRVSRQVLDNGLVVLIKEDHSVPAVGIRLQVRVGSIYETEPTSGYSHFLEHLVMRQSETDPSASIKFRLLRLGGLAGAATGFDKTNYSIQISSAYTSEALSIAAEILKKNSFTPDEVDKERRRVTDEMRRRRENIAELAYDEFPVLAMAGQPYEQRPIGTLEAINRAHSQDLTQWYKTFYAPNNAILAIVGDVHPPKIMTVIREVFGSLKPQRDLPAKPRCIPSFSGFSYRNKPTSLNGRSAVVLGALAPGFRHPDRYAVEILYTLLGEGPSSRLYYTLVSQESLASEVQPTYMVFENVGLMYFTVLPRTLKQTYEVPERLLSELGRLMNNGISEEELRQAKDSIHRKYALGAEDLSEQAMELSTSERLGGVHYSLAYLDNIERVTREAVQAAIARYLVKDNLKIASFIPKDMSEMPQERYEALTKMAAGFSTNSSLAGRIEFGRCLYSDQEARKIQRRHSKAASLYQTSYHRTRLKNGMTLIHVERQNLPLVSVALQIKAGASYSEKAGLAKTTSLMLMEGTETLNKDNFIKMREALGGLLTVALDREMLKVNATFLAKDFSKGIGLLADMIQKPKLDNTGLTNTISLLLSEIARRNDTLGSLSLNRLFQSLFQNQSYGQPLEGKPESLQTITLSDIKRFHRAHYRPDRAVLVVVGGVPYSTVAATISRDWSAWTPSDSLPDRSPIKVHRSETVRIRTPKDRAHITLGLPMSATPNDQFFLKELFGYVIGRRAQYELVYKQGISYDAGGFLISGSRIPLLHLYASTDRTRIEQAQTALVSNITGILKGDISDKDLEAYKRELIGVDNLFNMRSQSMAQRIATVEWVKQTEIAIKSYNETIRRINARELTHYAVQHMDLKNLTTVIVEPAE